MKWIRGFDETFFYVQLVAEGSASNRRGLGVAIARARRNYVEGSTVLFNQMNDSVSPMENVSKIEVFQSLFSTALTRTHVSIFGLSLKALQKKRQSVITLP